MTVSLIEAFYISLPVYKFYAQITTFIAHVHSHTLTLLSFTPMHGQYHHILQPFLNVHISIHILYLRCIQDLGKFMQLEYFRINVLSIKVILHLVYVILVS